MRLHSTAKDTNRKHFTCSSTTAAQRRRFLHGCKACGIWCAGIKILAPVRSLDEDYLPISATPRRPHHLTELLDGSRFRPQPQSSKRSQGYGQTSHRPDFGSVAAFDVMLAIYRFVGAQTRHGRSRQRTMEARKGLSFETPRADRSRFDPQARLDPEHLYPPHDQRHGFLVNVEFRNRADGPRTNESYCAYGCHAPQSR